jgi:nucleotide-binding universal stress UspA family protein
MTTAPSSRTEMPPAKSAIGTFQPLGALLRSSPVVVAVSGGPDGAAPVRVTAAISAHYGSPVSAIQVLDTSSIPAPLPYAFGLARDLIGDVPYEADVRDRRRQFAHWLGREVDWPVRVEVGTPASEILKHAETCGAGLIVLGLRRHGMIDRVLHDETTLNVARRARGAVLGVVPTSMGLPRKAVVGVDFGPASARAARAALDLLMAGATTQDPAVLRLVYVGRTGETREDTAGEAVITQLGVGAAFQALVEGLSAPSTVRVEWVIRHGTPADELLAFADEVAADLIAVGSLRHERIEQWLLGSVTTAVVRDGRCSVLVIPPP